MSDLTFITSPEGQFPTDPTSSQSEYSGGLAQAYFPLYSTALVSSPNLIAGQNGPLRFAVTRQDGLLCGPPVAALVTITPIPLGNGSPATATAYLEAEENALTQYLDVPYLFASGGLYNVLILISMPTVVMSDGSQIVPITAAEVLIVVNS